jgi:hypothetical protein
MYSNFLSLASSQTAVSWHGGRLDGMLPSGPSPTLAATLLRLDHLMYRRWVSIVTAVWLVYPRESNCPIMGPSFHARPVGQP